MKYVYSFDEGKKEMKPLLGGKGANLAEMASIGIPVPPGFTITTEACRKYYEEKEKLPQEIKEEIREHLKKLEERMNKKLGDSSNPLLVSVRSGAAVSMPGMMDTVLNLGLNDNSVEGLASKTSNEKMAWDSYRRFIQMFGNVVMGISHAKFEEILQKVKDDKGIEFDTELEIENLKALVEQYKNMIKEETKRDFPQNPEEQLWQAIDAVFSSWNNKRAIQYREINNIKGLLGTAVNVQSMVFGNMGNDSGTGVCFTRNPSTGENKFFGEYLTNAQGEDVVAGIRTPKPISQLQEDMPHVYEELVGITRKLENHYKDMQDIEFTIEKGKLYILQTRNGKRTALAEVKIAVDFEEEGLIDKKEALLKINPESVSVLLHKRLDPEDKKNNQVIAKGLPASPGAGVGKIVFNAEDAVDMKEMGEKVVLVRVETSPEDISGMNAAQGILTQRGGMTSHAAVVARGMGKCAVVGCSDISINEHKEEIRIGDKTFRKGDLLTLDGSTGEVFEGGIKVIDPEIKGNFAKVMEWSDEFRRLGVRTNADTPKDARKAREFGAEGIGLCRTEHMFFEGDRIQSVRKMILADNKEERKAALDELLPFQREDFVELFRAMKGLPVTIRLLDPPLHEFLPKGEEIKESANRLNVSEEELKEKLETLSEVNPMLGHRGCRLAITYPEIAEMQTQAILEAAIEVKKEGIEPTVEIMVPLIAHINELKKVKEFITVTADKIMRDEETEVKYRIGTMIEIPRAALTADEIAEEAEFFSFGTNDLTQMCFGFSRDDIGKFLPEYKKKEILEEDPFQTIDVEGVGKLIETAVERGRKTNPQLKIGICGEQGGEAKSVEFCHKKGLDYVSCSPFRVPVARLAAAQSAIQEEKQQQK
jgi:pyruvate,orthophosphate dikinase